MSLSTSSEVLVWNMAVWENTFGSFTTFTAQLPRMSWVIQVSLSLSAQFPSKFLQNNTRRNLNTSLILITWYLHHMTRLISCDWSHLVNTSLGGTNTAEVYSFHFPRVFTLLLHKQKPDALPRRTQLCTQHNNNSHVNKHDTGKVVKQDYSSRFSKKIPFLLFYFKISHFIQCVTCLSMYFFCEWMKVCA